MMNLKLIEQLSREAGEQAAEENREPLIAFVDNSGFGGPNEPALTVDQFISKVKSGLGYAIIEQGQFQIYIGVFEKTLDSQYLI